MMGKGVHVRILPPLLVLLVLIIAGGLAAPLLAELLDRSPSLFVTEVHCSMIEDGFVTSCDGTA